MKKKSFIKNGRGIETLVMQFKIKAIKKCMQRY